MKHGPTQARALLSILSDKRNLLIVTHDNPDPDAIATGMALGALVKERLGIPVELAFGGIIGRAENKAMVDALAVPLKSIEDLDCQAFDAVALVDTQPGAGNHSLPPDVRPTIVIDHHQPRQPDTDCSRFADVRTNYGASSTILVEYLRELEVTVDPLLATALFYGIKVDTQDLGRHATRSDFDAYRFLFPLVDKRLLPKIEYPRLPREYFETFHAALERAMLYDGVVISALDEVENPNAVAEVADLLLRLEGTVWSGCFGIFEDQLYLSIRTSDPEGNAYEVIARSMAEVGTRGGHGMLAGGRASMAGMQAHERIALRRRLTGQFLASLGVTDQAGRPLLRNKDRRGARVVGEEN